MSIQDWKGGLSVLIFVNAQLPESAITALGRFAETVAFSAPGLVYDAVSGHPDLFFVYIGKKLMVPPNLPQKYVQLLDERAICFNVGQSQVGFRYPESAKYNAVITEKYFIHNLRISDPLLLEHVAGLEKIHVSQGYTRCNLLALGNTHFITSDKGIYQNLNAMDLQVLFVDPKGIELPGFSHGFFGGACGVWQQAVFISGSLQHHPQGEEIRQFIGTTGFAVEELYDGPLFDGGSIVFVG
jgi:hypothetical protein